MLKDLFDHHPVLLLLVLLELFELLALRHELLEQSRVLRLLTFLSLQLLLKANPSLLHCRPVP